MRKLQRTFLVVASVIILLGCAGTWMYGARAMAAATSQGNPPTKIETDLADRTLSDEQRDIISHRVLRMATVSIVPLAQGEPVRFATELAAALREAGADVSIDRSNWIHSDQLGLIVFYDHTSPANASVFLALDRAGLKPEDRNIPGAPAVMIEVGPKN
jgi:hypothetical protein